MGHREPAQKGTHRSSERVRRHRERRRSGVIMVQIEMTPNMVNALVTDQRIRESERENTHTIADAVSDLVWCWANSTLVTRYIMRTPDMANQEKSA